MVQVFTAKTAPQINLATLSCKRVGLNEFPVQSDLLYLNCISCDLSFE